MEKYAVKKSFSKNSAAGSPIYAVCPRCGKRSPVLKFAWSWEEDETFAVIRCACGRFTVPFHEDRVAEVRLDNPYLPKERFLILLPREGEERLTRVGHCLMESWVEKAEGG